MDELRDLEADLDQSLTTVRNRKVRTEKCSTINLISIKLVVTLEDLAET
jgi:hypothetical protein